jgi:hypothetical protein
MPRLDPFTTRRLTKFIEDFRKCSGVLPTLQDFERAEFARDLIELAVKQGLIEQFYVTLTSGTVVKGFKIRPRHMPGR